MSSEPRSGKVWIRTIIVKNAKIRDVKLLKTIPLPLETVQLSIIKP